MGTTAVPGAAKRNMDKLSEGCWGEADDGSLILVVGHETGSVVFDLYDLDQQPPMFFRSSLIEKEFKEAFSVPPIGKSLDTWTWHDKTTFPWNRVMKRFSDITPHYADVEDQLSIAQRIAQRLGVKGKKVAKEDITPNIEQKRSRGLAVAEAIGEAIAKIKEF